MQHLYIMRHGQSMANAQQIIAGSLESPLSDAGKRQSEYAGQTAKQYFPIELIVSSPMTRAVQTAHIVARQLNYPTEKILVLDNLRERDLGDVEGQDYEHAPQQNGNYEDAENVPGVEPIKDLYDRMSSVLDQLRKRPEQHILVIAHNGCGRMLKVVVRGGKPLDMYNQPRLENAILYRLS